MWRRRRLPEVTRFAAATFAMAAAVTGCNGFETTSGLTPRDTPAATTPSSFFVCIDRSGSVPSQFLSDGIRYTEKRIVNAAARSTEPTVVYARTLDGRSYSPGNAVAALTIAPPPSRPTPPAVPSNPYLRAQRQTELANYSRALATWRHETTAWARRTEAAVAGIAPHDRADTDGTDLAGCPLRVSHLATSNRGDRTLIIISDLQPYGPQSPGHFDLSNFDVIIAFWCGEPSSECYARQSQFRRRLRAAHASSVRFIDPQQLMLTIQGGES
jgi:hypothetical protein